MNYIEKICVGAQVLVISAYTIAEANMALTKLSIIAAGWVRHIIAAMNM